ncbi:hypothetical protein MPTK1_6g10360 [Marchantia polymorpha subsp. ruderalis]|uniref:Heat shock 70 kDa protein 14 n=2 Tax=Marchantia polymorpha TaxID=3197 RepID=A0AAF6BQJ8_MARPO|nr:hypothetical protein MARPO_0016s0078 [Marchantia polymorpha]BBN14282.1 hypothetical protein Mp_6g10360 [Marchantia polymorpha subsp. ruderalis]|eukprot:PTQ45017.1 hypothetical protein MARPO_0016s0078 [Marchantia polymorpha]
MSVVGLDVGNVNCIIGVARQRGIDVVLNDECGRETPAMVSFSDKQRYIGTGAASTATMNPKNTISQIKRLIGRKFRDPEVQKDLPLFSFNVSEGPDGGPLINVNYLKEKASFTPTQILGMILCNLKNVAAKALGTTVVDCVIGIPVYFSELQRRAYLNAAAIAGLRTLRLMHETTATALAYGIYKPGLPDTDAFHVVFVDVGHASTQVSIAAFKKGQLKILAQAFDRCLGGRDFDEVLFAHFVDRFKQDYNINVASNARASQRLRAACEKLKKMLSANAEAPLTVECLMDEKDVRAHMKREEFESLAADLLERVRAPCERALADSHLSLDKIGAVEVVGSGSRIPAVLKIIASCFRKEPSRTLNASECIARGCTLQCAMMSPTFKVRHFEVQDSFPFPIACSWRGRSASPNAEAPDREPAPSTSSVVFVKGNALPSAKLLTFQRSGTFSIDVLYADARDLPPGTPLKIGTYQIGPFSPCRVERATLKVKIRLSVDGILCVESATLIEEDESEMPASKVKENPRDFPEALPMDTDKDGQNGVEPQDAQNLRTPESNAPESKSNSNSTKNESDGTQPETVKKKKSKRIDVPVQEVVLGALAGHELQRAVEKELEMALQDRVMEETKEKKNAVEAYVYDMRNKLSETFSEFVTEREQEELAAILQQTEFWLYEEGEDESKSVYVAKLAELKKLGDPVVERQREDEARGQAIEDLLFCINSYSDAAQSQDARYDHICSGDKEKVISECKKTEEWLKARRQAQDAVAKTEAPVFLALDVRKKQEALDKFCKPLVNKARPTAAKPNTEGPGEEKTTDKKDSSGFSAAGDGTPARSTETDKSRTIPETMQTE